MVTSPFSLPPSLDLGAVASLRRQLESTVSLPGDDGFDPAIHALECVPLNMLGDGDTGPDRTRACCTDDDEARLREIRRLYDPRNRFRFNHNIAPA